MFNVTMGFYDRSEISEFVGLYLLNQLSNVIEKSGIGLYRYYRHSAINNANGPKFDRIRKDITVLIKKESLSVTIETNLLEIDFLDFAFNLATEK